MKSKHEKYFTENLISRYLVGNFFQSIHDLIEQIKFSSILDIGCGEGHLLKSFELKINNLKCAAVDLDQDEVQDAKKNLPFCDVKVASVYSLPYEKKEFELVICTEVLEHLEEPEKAVIEIERVTSKYIILSVPREPLWRLMNIARLSYLRNLGNTPGHLNHWSSASFKAFVSKRLKVQKIVKSVPWTIILCSK
ncbi:MAG: class I SAM-dependent methyltransferase [Bacteroidetes bacterium]|nr:class I SAM-dependent methyltransferase [Bacteroidota bacterium]